MKNLILIFSVLLVAANAVANLRCEQMFSSDVGFLDHRYLNIVNKRPESLQERNAQISTKVQLLNSAFLPLTSKLNSVIGRASNSTLVNILKIKISSSNVERGQFQMVESRKHFDMLIRSAKIEPTSTEIEKEVLSMINATFGFNAGNGARKYRLGSEGDTLDNYQVKQPDIFASTSDFLWTQPNAEFAAKYGLGFTPLSPIVTPIGHYGRNFSEALLRTTQVMMELAHKNLQQESVHAHRSAGELLMGETARAILSNAEKTPLEMTALGTTLEGVLSLHQLFSSLLVQQVPGAKSGPDALFEIIFNSTTKNGIISELTARMPMGFIGPMTLSGHGFDNPLVRNSDGKLTLSPKLTKILKELKEEVPPERRKRVCPMAALFKTVGLGKDLPAGHPKVDEPTKTELQNLAESYWTIFQAVNKQLAGDY